MKKVFLITGSPASGKSTYAKAHAGKNDIIFDLDEINKALGGILHAEEQAGLNIALAMRQAAINEIARRKGSWENAYFITATADREEVKRLCATMGANEIQMTATLEECVQRAEHDDTRPDKAQAKALIEQWYKDAGKSEAETKSTREQFAEWIETGGGM